MERDAAYDRAIAYEEDGEAGGLVVYRASSLGGCVGALTRARLGVTASPPPALMLERFQEGTDWEQAVIDAGLGGEGGEWMQITDPDHRMQDAHATTSCEQKTINYLKRQT